MIRNSQGTNNSGAHVGRYWFYPHTVQVQMPCINAAQSQPRKESLCLSAYALPIGITEYISNRLGGSTSVKKVIRYIIRIGQKAHPALLLAIKSWHNRIKER